MEYIAVDRGWAWVVLPACFLSGVLNANFNYAAGVLNVALLEVYSESVAATALVGAVFTSLLCLFGPISSVIVNLTSCRVTHIIGAVMCFVGFTLSSFVGSLQLLFLTYGVIGGIGTGLVSSSAMIILGYSFDHYQGIAVGISVAGAGLGMFISGPATNFLLETYGLHGTFLIMGALSSHGIIFGLLMRPSDLEILHKKKREENERKAKLISGKSFSVKQMISFDVFRNKSFCSVLLATLMWNISYSVMLLHLPNFAVTQGASESDGAFLITMVGLGSVVNRLLTGMSLSKDSGLDPFLLEFGFLAVTGFITVVFPFVSHSQTGRCVFSGLFGIYSGGLITLFTPLAVYLLGIAQLPTGIGAFFLASGFGYIAGPPLAGFMVDTLNTYEYSFYVSGGILMLSAMIVLAASKWLEESKQSFSIEEIQVIDPTEAKIISGSALVLSGSFNYIMEIESPIKNVQIHKSKPSSLNEDGIISGDQVATTLKHPDINAGYRNGTLGNAREKLLGSNGTIELNSRRIVSSNLRDDFIRVRSGTFGNGERKVHVTSNTRSTLSIPDIKVQS